MFSSVVPILYYSPSIINQIAINNDNGLVVSKETTLKTNRSASIKVLIDKLFIPIGTEAKGKIDNEQETQTNTQFDELSRAIQAVKQSQEESVRVCEITQIDESNLDTFILIDGEFAICATKSRLDESMLIAIECKFGKYTVKGVTSPGNWTSPSLTNQLIKAGRLTASAIVFPLSISGKTIEAKFVCIFVL